MTKPCVFKSLLFKLTISNAILFNIMFILLVKISMFSLTIICKIRNQARKLTDYNGSIPRNRDHYSIQFLLVFSSQNTCCLFGKEKEWRELFHQDNFGPFFPKKILVAFLGKKGTQSIVPFGFFQSFLSQNLLIAFLRKKGMKTPILCSSFWSFLS